MKNILTVCERMNDLLCNPILHKYETIPKELILKYDYDLDVLAEHVVNCDICKHGLIEVYKTQEIPLFLKTIIDSIIQNKLRVKL